MMGAHTLALVEKEYLSSFFVSIKIHMPGVKLLTRVLPLLSLFSRPGV